MLRKNLILWFLWLAPVSAMGAESALLQPVCLEPIGVRELAEAQPELSGAAVRVGLIELSQEGASAQRGQAFVPNLHHYSLEGVNLRGLFYYQNPHRPAQYSAHASMIAGILVGDDAQANYQEMGSFRYLGIVPQAELGVYETNWFIYKCILSPSPEPVEDDVLTISWGTTARDAITMAWQRGIDTLPERYGCVIVAGCGNGREKSSTINKPSWGYNVISVGTARNMGNFADCLRYVGPPVQKYSSFGPTDDGRAKPDVLAAGLYLGPDALTNDGYWRAEKEIGYSSFAAPQIAGIAALLMDAARQNQLLGGDDPRVIKALILNGANKLVGWHKGYCDPNDDDYYPLDLRQGAGLAHVGNSLGQLRAGRYDLNVVGDPNSARSNTGWDLAEIGTDPNSLRKIYVLGKPLQAGDDFKATLTWYRRYQPRGIFNPLPLEKLILELWAIDEQGRLVSRLDYSASERDNLQHIYYHSDEDQRVALEVRLVGGDDEQQADRISYALAYSGEDDNWSGDQLGADFNVDGIVDVHDLLEFLSTMRLHRENEDLAEMALDEPFITEDLNGDGRVNKEDFDIFSQEWQKRSPWYREN
jgi:hypothetical protein